MRVRYRFGRPIRERLQVLEEPGKPLPFDADRGLVAELSAQFGVNRLVEELKERKGEEGRVFREFGRRLMEETIHLADGKYRDRAADIIEKVARQTGVSFPHRFERYIELSILGTRPLDRWNISKATTRELRLQVFSCSVAKALKEAGLEYPDLPCREMCLASFEAAAQKTGDRLRMEMAKRVTDDGLCEFAFYPMEEGGGP
jgi:hypothetical protein